MKTRCIFVPRDHSNGILPDSYDNFCLDNPVGTASFPLAGACGLAATYRAYFFIKNARPHHAHRNHHTTRPAARRTHSPRNSAAKGRCFIGKTPTFNGVQLQLTG